MVLWPSKEVGAYSGRGLLYERNLHFKIGWAYNWREFVSKLLNVQLVILRFWLEIRNTLITLKMPSSNTIAINFIRTEIQ